MPRAKKCVKIEENCCLKNSQPGLVGFLSEIEVVKNKESDSVCVNVLVRRGELLEYIQVSDMGIQVGCKLISDTRKKPVLIEVVVDYIFPCVDHQFIA